MKNTIPFTYLITHIPSGKRYYGVRFKKGCNPSELWTSYFTSSKVIKQLIAQDGTEAFEVSVRRLFETQNAALSWEQRVLARLKVMDNDGWLNQHVSSEQFRSPREHSPETKEKIRLKMQCRQLTEEHKRRISEASLKDRQRRKDEGWTYPTDAIHQRQETRKQRIESGEINPYSEERNAKIAASKRGKKRKYLADDSYIMVSPEDL